MAEAGWAFGVRLLGDRLPTVVPGPDAPAPTAEVRLVGDDVVTRRWAQAAAPRRLFERREPGDELFLAVDRDPAAGFRVWARGHGTHLVAVDGTQVASALPRDGDSDGRRLVAAQLLPLLAALHGHELLHGGGVLIDGRLVAIVAASGTGKSSTAAHLILQGGAFFADDVLALAVDRERVVASPGPRLMSVYDHELADVPEGVRPRLGRLVGTDEKLLLEPAGETAPRPLAGVAFLRRDGGAASLRPVDDPAPVLLGNAYLPYLDTPDRLVRQITIAAALAASVPLVEITAGDDDAAAVARRVRAWAGSLG